MFDLLVKLTFIFSR